MPVDPSLEPRCSEKCAQFQKNTGIEADRFLQELTKIKQKQSTYKVVLSDNQIRYICLSLDGNYSKEEIAYYVACGKIPDKKELEAWENRERKPSNLKSEMSSTVHKYVNEFMRVDRFQGWERVIEFLQNNGYDRSSSQNRKIRKTTQIQISIEHEHDVDEGEILRELQQILQDELKQSFQDKMNRQTELRISLEKKV
jgi:citrate synthase